MPSSDLIPVVTVVQREVNDCFFEVVVSWVFEPVFGPYGSVPDERPRLIWRSLIRGFDVLSLRPLWMSLLNRVEDVVDGVWCGRHEIRNSVFGGVDGAMAGDNLGCVVSEKGRSKDISCQ